MPQISKTKVFRTIAAVALFSMLASQSVFQVAHGSVNDSPTEPAVAATSPRPYSRRPSKDALKWADKELQKMALDEKIGQLISVGINATFLNQDSEAFKALRHQVVDNHVDRKSTRLNSSHIP